VKARVCGSASRAYRKFNGDIGGLPMPYKGGHRSLPGDAVSLEFTISYLADHAGFLPGIAAWQHAQFGYLNPVVTIEQRADRLRESLRGDRLPMSLIAIDRDTQLLGSASILATTLTHKHLTPWLSSVFVPPGLRGHGIASALSLRANDEAARLGYETLYLFTPHSEKLYSRIGWQTFDTILHNEVPLSIMSRPTGGQLGK
jgi:N-acetylglutamate synthase-like GNAT family acetyltransferase